MDVENIATIIAPSIISSGSKEFSADELLLSISVFKSMILHHNMLWLVPDSITHILQRLGENEIEEISGNRVFRSQELLLEYRKEIIRRQNSKALVEPKNMDMYSEL